MSISPSWLVKAITILIGILLPLGGTEIWLRATGFSYPVFFAADPVTGQMHRPNVEGWYREEGGAFVRINSAGLRDREHAKAKPAGVVRIVVLGDSYAEALQVPLEQTFWAILERELNACRAFGPNIVEIINLGVSGFGTGQELLALRTWGLAYRPDIVLLAFLTGNDISDNSKELNHLSSPLRPYFIQSGADLMLDQSFLSTSDYKKKTGKMWALFQSLSDHIRLLQFFYRAKHRLQQNHEEQSAQVMIGHPRIEKGINGSVFGEPLHETWKVAWEITERLLLIIREESRSKGARFVLATLSNGIQVLPDPEKRQALMRQLNIQDLFYPDTRLRHLGERERFEVITLAPVLQQHAEKQQETLHGFGNAMIGFGHWNEYGHRVAGQHLARYFCEDVTRSGMSK